MKIKIQTHSTNSLTFSELGLLVYMLANADREGNFQEHLSVAAKVGNSTVPTVYRWQQNLIKHNAVEVVKPSRRGSDGFQIPPVLRPKPVSWMKQVPIPSKSELRAVEQVQVTDNKESKPVSRNVKPVPNGTLTTEDITDGSIRSGYRGVDDIPHMTAPIGGGGVGESEVPRETFQKNSDWFGDRR